MISKFSRYKRKRHFAKERESDQFIEFKDHPSVFKVFGGDLPAIVVYGCTSEEALCFARRIDLSYCATQSLEPRQIKRDPDLSYNTLIIFRGNCFGCEELSFHFTKSTCAFDKIPDVCESEVEE